MTEHRTDDGEVHVRRIDDAVALPNCLAALRKRKGINQEDFGRHVGVSRETISNIERRIHSPALPLALRIAWALGVPVERIFFLTDPPGRIRVPRGTRPVNRRR